MPELRGRLRNRLFALGNNQDCVARGQDGIGCRNEIVLALANHRHLHVAQRFLRQIAEPSAGKAFADRDLSHVKALRLCREFWLHDARHEVDAEDRDR